MNIIEQEFNNLLKSNNKQAQIIELVKSVADQFNLDIYIVGGFVRDLYLGKRSTDLDFMISNIPSKEVIETVKNIIKNNPNYLNKFQKIIQQNKEERKIKNVVIIENIDDLIKQCGGALCAAILVQQRAKSHLIEVYHNTMTVMIYVFGEKIEFAHARSEEYLITRLKGMKEEGSRRPIVKPVTDIIEDIKRRDFTINALMISLKDMEIIDKVGGIQDLENGIIRVASGDTLEEKAKIFEVDPLRIIRAARFTMLQSNINENITFKLDPETREAMKKAMQTDKVITGFSQAPDSLGKDYSQQISIRKIRRNKMEAGETIVPGAYMPELKKILLSNKPSVAINILGDVGFLKYISNHLQELYDDQKRLRELAASHRIPRYAPHKEIWTHTMNVLDSASISDSVVQLIENKVRQENPEGDISQAIADEINKYLLILRTSALFHDVGKVTTRKLGYIFCPKCGNEVSIDKFEELPFVCSFCSLNFKIPGLIQWLLQEAHNKKGKVRNLISIHQKPNKILFECSCGKWKIVPEKPGRYRGSCGGISEWQVGSKNTFNRINTKVTFHNHEQQSANITSVCLSALQFTKNEVEEIVHLIFNHGMKFGDIRENDPFTDVSDRMIRSRMDDFARHRKGRDTEEESNIRRFMVLELQRADVKANKKDRAEQLLQRVLDRYNEMIAEDREKKRVRERILNGNDLMQMFGLTGGPWLGKIVQTLDTLVREEYDPSQEKQGQVAYELLEKIIEYDSERIQPINPEEFKILLEKHNQNKIDALKELISTKYSAWFAGKNIVSHKYSWIKIAKKYEFF